MAILHFFTGGYTGKLGDTVGSKWKNLNTGRAYVKPRDANTPDQRIIRDGFGAMSSFCAQFTDQIRNLSALNTKGMTVRNAIVKLNKSQISTGVFDPETLVVSRGGLPQPTEVGIGIPAGLMSILFSFWPAVGATISAKAKVVLIIATPDGSFSTVGTALNSAGSLTITGPLPANTGLHYYWYLLDYRGSSRVASRSQYNAAITPPS